MAFCRYCGKELLNGACDCAESQAARQTSGQQTAGPQGPIYQQGGQQQGQQYQQAKETFREVKGSFMDFFRNPMDVVDNAYRSAGQAGQYAVAGVYAAAVTLFVICLFDNTVGTTEKGFATGLKLALGALAVKGLYAAIVWFLAKQRDASVPFSKVLGVFCLVTIPETAMFAVMVVISFIDMPSLLSVAFTATLMVSVISPVIATLTVMQGDHNRAFLVSLLMQVVAAVLVAVVSRVVMNSILHDLSYGQFDMDDISDAMRQMQNGMREFRRGISMRGIY